ncbi:E3 ubiquitin-protein ligase RAD18-like isoform X2 [Belonocnema kinseyi]|uniref:E3 ubiquitin-protein ligase RAD18-like isoform X2 n=1 Tax=Belonocnema kinseyi TaxID=2817044 RepID=UPI00143CEC7B|nr:E3 ubiquitin-protein ligase RAD18-like isoform X2 [Belonocnema kinseyi]
MDNTNNNWPEEFSALKSIEDSLTCGICYEFMETAVMTPCSHNYCSLCIRKYLNYKSECPACFNQVFDTDLRVNRTLDNIKQNFLKVRDKLKLCMKGIGSGLELTVVNEPASPVKSRLNQLVSTPKTGNKSPGGITRSEEFTTPIRSTRVNSIISSPFTPNRTGNKSAQDYDSSMLMFSPSTSGIAPIFNPVKSKTPFKREENGPTVPCPVCTVKISETHINRHLDDCLKRESNTSGPKINESKLKAIPKLVLNLMRDPELRRRLKEYGLSTAGDSKALKTRLNKFYILYNAERDKPVQRSLLEISKQCEDEEQIEKKMLAFNKSQIQKSLKGQSDNYCETNKSSFEKLIEQVKSRNPKKKSNTDSNERDLTSSGNEEQISETAINVSNDSDSGTSSLLQQYPSEGPMKFLEIQYSGSDNIREIPENSEADSVIEGNRIESIDEETNFTSPGKMESRFRNPEEKLDSSSASMFDDTSNESEIGPPSPILNKKPSAKKFPNLENNCASSGSDLIDPQKPKCAYKGKFTPKRPKMSKLNFNIGMGNPLPKNIPDIEALEELLENKGDELKDISLDVSDDSVPSNTSKGAEEIEEPLETSKTPSDEETLCGVNGDKENEPLCPENEQVVVPRSTRKRGRPSRYLDDEGYAPTESNLPLKNVFNESTTFEVALDGTLEEIESPPEKILKRRRGRPKALSPTLPSAVEMPQRVLRRRLGESSKSGLNNS